MPAKLSLSPLPHTWIFDVDGTLVKHNGYKIDGYDTLLDGVKELFAAIPAEDMIILLTSRKNTEKENLENFMKQNGLRYNHIIFNAPMGERVLINDNKPSGLTCAYAVNKARDEHLNIPFKIDEDL